jgi:GDP-L-fucose synthase
MVGSALVGRLGLEGCEILTAPRATLDLRRQDETEAWLAEKRPQVIFLAAARVGGICANQTRPAEFLYDNLAIASNVIEAAHRLDVEKLIYLGSSCIYPKAAPQPMREDALLTGPLEPTNEAYAIAKIAGLKLAEAYRSQYGRDFISAMPTNLYGPRDNFDLETSHVVPALIRKAHEAKVSAAESLLIWGTGKPRREFLYVDDCADGLVFIAKTYSDARHINVGSGEELTILELGGLIAEVVGFEGDILLDESKPDGTPRKLLDSTRLTDLGWKPRIPLREGLKNTYRWFLENDAKSGAAVI